jgi:hypothetical protein
MSNKQANQLARVMASDIALYNEAKIRRGIENDTLFEEIAEDLRDAERNWRERVDADLADDLGVFYRAFVDLVFGASRVKSEIF